MPGAQITAPCTGTITGWHVRGYHSVVPANVKLRVLHPNGTGQYTGAGTSSPITLGTTDAVLQASTSLPINAGDFIGLDVPDNLTFDLASTTGAFEPFWQPPLVDGGSPSSPNIHAANTELLINAQVACPAETLADSRTGTGGGAVTSSDGGIDCGATCSAAYLPEPA